METSVQNQLFIISHIACKAIAKINEVPIRSESYGDTYALFHISLEAVPIAKAIPRETAITGAFYTPMGSKITNWENQGTTYLARRAHCLNQ